MVKWYKLPTESAFCTASDSWRGTKLFTVHCVWNTIHWFHRFYFLEYWYCVLVACSLHYLFAPCAILHLAPCNNALSIHKCWNIATQIHLESLYISHIEYTFECICESISIFNPKSRHSTQNAFSSGFAQQLLWQFTKWRYFSAMATE